jgi:hypothetical protein
MLSCRSLHRYQHSGDDFYLIFRQPHTNIDGIISQTTGIIISYNADIPVIIGTLAPYTEPLRCSTIGLPTGDRLSCSPGAARDIIKKVSVQIATKMF